MMHWESGALCWAEFVHGPEQSPVFSTWCGYPQDLGSRACRPSWHSPCGQAQHPAVAMLGPYSGLRGSSSGALGAFASCCVQALVWVMEAKRHSGLPNITYCKKKIRVWGVLLFFLLLFSLPSWTQLPTLTLLGITTAFGVPFSRAASIELPVVTASVFSVLDLLFKWHFQMLIFFYF